MIINNLIHLHIQILYLLQNLFPVLRGKQEMETIEKSCRRLEKSNLYSVSLDFVALLED